MDPPRVFLICVNRLVCEAVNVLLRREGIELLGMETDSNRALVQICMLQPDIVLVEGNGDGADAGLMSRLAALVFARDNLRVIRLSIGDGQVHIYHQEQRRLVTTQDLIAAIRGEVGDK
ncbi:MAG: hypothetical protein HY782_07285 [Chloroflexi bacterium]|nr:hypothetical protein [Chloroflexota bacterium]